MKGSELTDTIASLPARVTEILRPDAPVIVTG